VAIDADVPNSTTFNVTVSNSSVSGGPFLAGTITSAAFAGEVSVLAVVR